VCDLVTSWPVRSAVLHAGSGVGTQPTATSHSPLTDGAWHNVTCTRTPQIVTMFVDGDWRDTTQQPDRKHQQRTARHRREGVLQPCRRRLRGGLSPGSEPSAVSPVPPPRRPAAAGPLRCPYIFAAPTVDGAAAFGPIEIDGWARNLEPEPQHAPAVRRNPAGCRITASRFRAGRLLAAPAGRA
jgi:hypothetical protein